MDVAPFSAARAIVGALAVTALDAVLLAAALGGFGVLLHHARALALLAVWLAGGLLLGWIRPVRRHAPVSSTREPGWTLPVLFFLPLLTPPLAALGERFAWALLPGGGALRWTGVVVSGAGLFLRIAAMARLGSRFSPCLVTQEAHALETRGVYARVRHPGYLGTLLAALGAVLAFGSALGLVTWAPLLLVLLDRIRREERLLDEAFGETWRRYRARTGSLLPRLAGARD